MANGRGGGRLGREYGLQAFRPANAMNNQAITSTPAPSSSVTGRLTSTITYRLPIITDVQFIVFDITCLYILRLVDGYVQAGTHHIVWNASDQASGIYIAKLITRQSSQTIKMVLLK